MIEYSFIILDLKEKHTQRERESKRDIKETRLSTTFQSLDFHNTDMKPVLTVLFLFLLVIGKFDLGKFVRQSNFADL